MRVALAASLPPSYFHCFVLYFCCRNLIDHFIPFLPLERQHVRLCVKDALLRLSEDMGRYLVPSADLIEEILEELQWFPADSKLYSKSGCKKIDSKVKLLV